MTKQQIQKEWKKLTLEINDKPNINGYYPSDVIRMRELLLFAQVELARIEDAEDKDFHVGLYQTTMRRYFRWKKCLKI